MKLSAPTTPVFVISEILGLAGLLTHFGVIPGFSGIQPFMLLAIGFVLLTLGNLFKGV